MSRIMQTAVNTMNQLQKQMDIISHNIANSNTQGYKKKSVQFSELMYQQFPDQHIDRNEPGRLTPNGTRVGVGGGIAQTQTDFQQGSFVNTGRTLDLALSNPLHFFNVLVRNEDETQIQFTKSGNFYLSPINEEQVALVTSEGHQVLDENNNPIIFTGEMEELLINEEGIITYTNMNGDESQIFALGISHINRPQNLLNLGENLWAMPEELADENGIIINVTGVGRTDIGLKQGFLEQSNVNIGEEMTNLLQMQRSYQLQSRAISIADQMQGLINGIR